jgi:hypothetical protein
MSNDSLLETIEKQIAEMEGKLQKEMKSQPESNLVNNDMRELLKHLHEKRREILKRKSQK